MAYPARYGDNSPDNGYYSSDSSSPRRSSPTWRGSKRKMQETRKSLQLVGIIVVVITAVWFIQSSWSSTSMSQEDLLSGGVMNKNYFVDFEGGLDCRLYCTELYTPALHNTPQAKKEYPVCKNRAALLEAASWGGRPGFDMPYMPRGCHYKWYSAKEICMILDRFDGVVFLGDEVAQRIYAAFNILLRQDLVLGSLQQWRMSDKQRELCRCGRQFTNGECFQFFVTQNDDVREHDSESHNHHAPYVCNRVPHFYLPVSGSPAQSEYTQRFSDLLDLDPHSWKPIAMIHSLGLATHFEWDPTIDSMDEWLTIADNSGRNTPFLWVGPNAAGHLKPPQKIMQEGNNALWHYTHEMANQAWGRAVDVMSMYNMTVQANSYDGSNYGEKVTLVQAMMIVNWLARLETT